MKVMIVVTHLLGTGHLSRALTLARAFADESNTVTLVSGGLPVGHFDTSGIRFLQLPALRSDGTDFTTLLDADGAVAVPDVMQRRENVLLDCLAQGHPDVLITELFPFGRRILRNEFIALLMAACQMQPRPLVLSSIRDILAPPSKPAKAAFADDMVARFYDGVLVHADPEVVTLDQSWPVGDMLAARLHYTGFVAPKAPPHATTRGQDILVSAGGGNVGDVVFDAACGAARDLPAYHWRLFVGGAEARRKALAAKAPANVTVEPPSPEFRGLLTSAAASVSMAGYNTALDVLQTGVPAVIVPFDDAGEIEQTLRANALSALPAMSVILQQNLTGSALAERVKAVIGEGPRTPRIAGMNGAERTVQISRDLHKAMV